ncbi:MAG: HNH endonuclease [Firmicutes bacterium]|nr:HNH endonuclease [Bacillota bacterium]
MRNQKENTSLFFDAFKHLKNNISNLIFLELPELSKKGVKEYLQIKDVNHKSKFPDMRKIGLIEYKKPSDNVFNLTNTAEEILNKTNIFENTIARKNNKRLATVGKDLFSSDFYSSSEYKQISNLLLELELNYYDDAVSIRPYFILFKIIFNNKISKLTDPILLDILSSPINTVLNLEFKNGAFDALPQELQEKVKRPKSYIYDFIKTARIIDTSLNVIVDENVVSNIILQMNEQVQAPYETTVDISKSRSWKLQNSFRENLLFAYNFKCAVTEQSIAFTSKNSDKLRYLLDAAHIVPYSDGGSFSTSNGILLSPELHLYYDYGIITFEYENENLFCKVSQSQKVIGANFLKDIHFKKVSLPENPKDKPDKDALIYKTNKCFIK